MRKKRRADGTEIVSDGEEEEEEAKVRKNAPPPPQVGPAPLPERPLKKQRVERKNEPAVGFEVEGDQGEATDEAILLEHLQREAKRQREVNIFPAATLPQDRVDFINRNVSECVTHNVVTQATLGYKFPSMAALAIRLNGIRVKRQMEVCVSMLEPRATARIFRTGKVSIVGAKSAAVARQAIYAITRYINEKMNLALIPSDISVNNTMAMMYLNYRLDVDRLCREVTTPSGREIEKVFGAANVAVAGGVALLFPSGKIVIFGPREAEDLARVRELLLARLPHFFDGEIDPRQLKEEKLAAERALQDARARLKFENNVTKRKLAIETGDRRVHHRYNSKAFQYLVDLAGIQISDCLHLVGDLKRLNAANRAKVALPEPTVSAIDSPEKDVCRHRLFIRYKGSDETIYHPIGVAGSVDIVKLYRRNNLALPHHFLVPPPPVQKRHKVKNPTGEEGEFHRVEGVNLRFALAPDGQERVREPKADKKKKKVRIKKRPAAAAAAAAAVVKDEEEEETAN